MFSSINTWFEARGIYSQQVWRFFNQTLQMTFISALAAYCLAIPLGIILVTTKKGGIFQNRPVNIILGSIINIMRSIPFLLLAMYLIPFTRLLVGTALGPRGMIVPLTIAAVPFIARLIENALLELDKGLIEAAKSMGAGRFKIILKVYLPECAPSIILTAGVSVITILGFSAMAGIVAGGGLGQWALDHGHGANNTTVILTAIILLILIAQAVQGLVFLAHRVLNKK
ncbi:MAG: ABC transporter permease [Firmicutes bacterium]|nr:ABC transporter permease [Bacillota bacterium]